ncbi:MAG: winged helix-turn-helix domain-containing protein [Myxococcota bacterium]
MLARDPSARVRDIANDVGVTERAVQRILSELEEAGVIERERVGRRNHYHLDLDRPLRHPLEANHTIGELLATLLEAPHQTAPHQALPHQTSAHEPELRSSAEESTTRLPDDRANGHAHGRRNGFRRHGAGDASDVVQVS